MTFQPTKNLVVGRGDEPELIRRALQRIQTGWLNSDALAALAAVTPAADKLPYFTSTTAADVCDLTTFARTILDDVDEATFKATVNLEIGTDVQAWDAQLDDVAALAVADGNFIVGDGANWVAESGATARTSLGLGTGDNVIFTQLSLGTADTAYDLIVKKTTVGGVFGNLWNLSTNSAAYSVMGVRSDGVVGSLYAFHSAYTTAYLQNKVILISGSGTTGIYISATGTSPDIRFHVGTSSAANERLVIGNEAMGMGISSFDATGRTVFVMANGTAPAGNLTNAFQLYSADFAAGQACPHIRTENGTIIKLNQDVSTTASPTFATLTLSGDLNHDGSNIGFFAVAPVARASAYTQTYSTAEKTHAARTAVSMGDLVATSGGWGASTEANFDKITTAVDQLIADQIDTAQVLNALIDDLQAYGILQ